MGIRKKFNLGKIIIGTANFGNKYGFKKKKLNKKEISKILNYSNKFGIKTIDTAINYGNSEKEIGKCKNNNLKIISKIPEIPENLSRIDTYVNKLINRSIKNLKVKKLYGVLIHNAEDLLSEKVPSENFVTVEQLGGLCSFLCSDNAEQLTGQDIAVDGGWTSV